MTHDKWHLCHPENFLFSWMLPTVFPLDIQHSLLGQDFTVLAHNRQFFFIDTTFWYQEPMVPRSVFFPRFLKHFMHTLYPSISADKLHRTVSNNTPQSWMFNSPLSLCIIYLHPLWWHFLQCWKNAVLLFLTQLIHTISTHKNESRNAKILHFDLSLIYTHANMHTQTRKKMHELNFLIKLYIKMPILLSEFYQSGKFHN